MTTSTADQSALEEYLNRSRLTDAVRFGPEEDDELDADACAGEFECVVFADLDALLTAMFKGDVKIERWMERGVRIVLAASPESQDWRAFVREACGSLNRWRRVKRRRQVIACAILSAIALAGIAVLLLLVAPGK